ncbi:MAG: ATP-dependent helicase HrpB [Cytophagales bacterium]|nr:ATP-dependent helicase HrpB [Cytophagales bacterium]
MTFDPHTIDLPIVDVLDEASNQLSENNTVILHAPPGAGKSTLLPLALLDLPFLKEKKILMLEPRRLAAKSIAQRMSTLLEEPLGKTVGYRIRFETRVSDTTRIEVLTEGILTRMLQNDQELENVGLIIFDEFHERSIHADAALALCREAQSVLRPELRLLIMSATLNVPQLSSLLNAPVVASDGRQYPVEIIYTGEPDRTLIPEMASQTIIKAAKENDGDILAFFPGQGEIRKSEELLRRNLKGFHIHPLYGQLPFKQQQAAIWPNREGKRKVVLATSIAETSLTIEGIKVVVDAGYGRASRFDPRSGLSALHTHLISKDVADQRAGRAGRLEAGKCYRMWSLGTHERLDEHRTPEIMEADLASLVLDLALWGITDVNQLTWLTPPPKGKLKQASDILHELGALDKGRITEHGKKMHKIPCHPRLAHLLLIAEEQDLLDLATDLAAVLEERDPLPPNSGIDINLRIEALRKHRSEDRQGRGLSRIEKVAASYRKLFDIESSDEPVDDFETGFLLAQAYPERIASARPGNNAQFQLANGKLAMAGHRDDLAHEAWLAVAHLDARDGMGKIFLASPLNPQDLAPLVKEVEIVKWDTDDGGLVATKDLRIGNIILQSKPLPEPDESRRSEAILNAVREEGAQLLDISEEVKQLQYRVLSLRKWNPGGPWPDLSLITLLLTVEEWLSPYLDQIKKPEDFRKLNLIDILTHFLPYELQQELSEKAPIKIEVPSGSNIKIEYFEDGAPPVLAARLQELFGMGETPKINNGKTGLLMHLLSPGFKPVQITSDLKSFWDNTYFEVRKELKRRYPKHEWPDDPWSAEAVRGVKRRNKQ